MVASANGVVAWRRRPGEDPVLAILGGDRTHPARLADKLHMRYLRCFGDVGVGAETVRAQPELILTPQQPGDPPLPELFAFRARAALPPQPRNIVYSLLGRLPLGHRIFTTPGIHPLVVTTPVGGPEIRRRARGAPPPALLIEELTDPAGLRRAHEKLFADFGVRYLDCEGGETILRALRAADLLDEVFVTSTPVVIDESAHEGVLKILDFAREGATLIAEGRATADERWTFRRWRFSRR
ncbi:MAG TPA: dihydrofolate reductase family protein [Methylomirabilota bacterium]|nr:dihydrofolate reductase family protein [Methylomirabilota bacterium]